MKNTQAHPPSNSQAKQDHEVYLLLKQMLHHLLYLLLKQNNKQTLICIKIFELFLLFIMQYLKINILFSFLHYFFIDNYS